MQSRAIKAATSTSLSSGGGIIAVRSPQLSPRSTGYPHERPESVRNRAKPRVLIVHALPLVRFGLAKLIEADRRFVLCAKTGNAPSARALFVREQPQLAILGLMLNGGDGIELIKDFRKLNPLARSVVFSARTDRLSIERAFRAGACGYLLVSEGTAEVLHALSRVNAGQFYASQLVLRQMLDKGAAQIPNSELQHLSDRELQVLSLIGRGFGASRLAYELHLSVKTIETYQMHLKVKLGLHSAAELSEKASEWMVRSARQNLQRRISNVPMFNRVALRICSHHRRINAPR